MGDPAIFLVAPRAKVVPFLARQLARLAAVRELPTATARDLYILFDAEQAVYRVLFKAFPRAFKGPGLLDLVMLLNVPPRNGAPPDVVPETLDQQRARVLGCLAARVWVVENAIALARGTASFFPITRTYVRFNPFQGGSS